MNKYFVVDYKLFSVKNGERTLEEETSEDEPFVMISGFGTTIPGFEKNIENLVAGDTFDFTIPAEGAYGRYIAERVVKLPRPEDESQFDLRIGAIIPLQNEDGNRFLARIIGFEGDQVKLDLNHPLAGCDLNFQGSVRECREATNEEITQLINSLSGSGCGGGCKGGCKGGDCDKDGNCNGDGCNGSGCGHCKD
jgi:FKBP-type peptidyl-prolyl cis-trans isomerase SlyD